MVSKEKLLNKYKKIFFLEYLAIAAVLILIGFLRLFNVMEFSETRLLVYNIITLVGVAYLIFDLIWNLRPAKRRDFSLIDKLPPLLIGMFLLVFDILTLSKILVDIVIIKYCIVAVLLAAGCYAIFMGFYHYKKPQKMLYEAVEEAYQAALEEEAEEAKKAEQEKAEENPEK